MASHIKLAESLITTNITPFYYVISKVLLQKTAAATRKSGQDLAKQIQLSVDWTTYKEMETYKPSESTAHKALVNGDAKYAYCALRYRNLAYDSQTWNA